MNCDSLSADSLPLSTPKPGFVGNQLYFSKNELKMNVKEADKI